MEGEERVPLYLDIVKQASKIFDLGSAFAAGLIKAVKKDKSWAIEKWSKHDVGELLAPLSKCDVPERPQSSVCVVGDHLHGKESSVAHLKLQSGR